MGGGGISRNATKQILSLANINQGGAGAASKNEKWHLFDLFGECNLEMLLSLILAINSLLMLIISSLQYLFLAYL